MKSLCVISILFASLSACGGSPQEHLNQGADLLEGGRWTEAIQQFEMATKLQPDLSEAHYMIGKAVLDEREKCLSIFPDGRPDKGLEALRRAIELEPDNGEYYYTRGLLYFSRSQRDVEKALADLDRALEIGTLPAMAYYGKAQIHGSSKNFTIRSREFYQPGLALEEINLAIELEPQHAIFYAERAKISNVANRWVFQPLGEAYPRELFLAAVSDLKKAIELDPGEPLYYADLAGMLRIHSEHNSSITYYNLYIKKLEAQQKADIEERAADMNCQLSPRRSLADGYRRRAEVWEKLGEDRHAYDDRLAACNLEDSPLPDCLRPR